MDLKVHLVEQFFAKFEDPRPVRACVEAAPMIGCEIINFLKMTQN